MSEFTKRLGRILAATGFSISLFLGIAPKLFAQELSLRRDIPGTDPPTCPAIELDVQPTEEEADQANRMGSQADIQNSLGDQEQARDLFQVLRSSIRPRQSWPTDLPGSYKTSARPMPPRNSTVELWN